MYRIGQSQDIHRLENNGRPLILAGVKINSTLGPVSHSDGDVVFHALTEAILGALALGDLGHYYPSNDPKYFNIDSSYFVNDVYRMMHEKKFEINNIDINIILEKIRLKDYILQMRKNIAELLHTNIDNISVKAQTNEGCDDLGKGNAVMATAICLLMRKDV